MNIYKIIPLLLCFVFSRCNTEVINNTPVTEPSEQNDPKENTEAPAQPKTDAEVILEGGKTLAVLLEKAVDNAKQRDSLRMAHREKMFAYQIGLVKTNKEDLFEGYNKLVEASIKNIYVFKVSRRDFILVQYEGKSEQELENNIGVFRDQLKDVVSESIEKINLMDFCGKKEIVKKGDNLINKRESTEIGCLICD